MIGEKAGSEGERELWIIIKRFNRESISDGKEEGGSLGWNEVDGLKLEAGSRDKVKHIEKNDQLLIKTMMNVDD